MSSYSYTESTTFTVTHARHMAAKIATDLKRMQRLYGQPYDWQITQFEEEAVAIMKAGYLADVTYGSSAMGSGSSRPSSIRRGTWRGHMRAMMILGGYCLARTYPARRFLAS